MPDHPDWHVDPTDPELFRYWDGTNWTDHTAPRYYEPLEHAKGTGDVESPPRQGSPRLARLTIGLIVAEVAVLIWGGWMLSQAEENDCEVSEFTYTDPGDLPWLPWLVLVVLVMTSYALQADANVRWMKVTSITGVIVAVATFPGLVACAGIANCGL